MDEHSLRQVKVGRAWTCPHGQLRACVGRVACLAHLSEAQHHHHHTIAAIPSAVCLDLSNCTPRAPDSHYPVTGTYNHHNTALLRHHGRLRLLQPQPQCRPPRPGRAPAQSYKHRNHHCRRPLRRRRCHCSRHTRHQRANSGRQGASPHQTPTLWSFVTY